MRPSEADATSPPRYSDAPRPGMGAAVLARDPINGDLADPGRAPRTVEAAPESRIAPERGLKVLQRIDDRSPERANRQALDDLARGADGFSLVFQGAPNAFGHGLPATPEALEVALRDLPFGRIHLRIDVHPQSRASVDWLVRLLSTRRVAPERLDVSFGIDPAAAFASSGMLRMSIEALMASMPQSLAHYFALGVPGILLEADGRVFHNAGADAALELGATLSSTTGYLRMFQEARQPALYAAAHVGFAVSVEPDRAATAVKLAALGRLWTRLLDSYDVEHLPARIHAETSYRIMSAADPEANLARAALAALGAAEAGASTVAVLPSDTALRQQDESVRRRERNLLSLMLREAGGTRETMPNSAFAAAVDDLCDAGWEELRRIEAEGGILQSLRGGHLQRRVIAARDAQAAAIQSSPASGVALPQGAGHASGRGLRPDEPSGGAVFCQRLDPVRWEELAAAAAA